MRIRRRPSLPPPPPPLQTPDLSSQPHELKTHHPWRPSPPDPQHLNKKALQDPLLHSPEDPQLQANKASPFFNPDQPGDPKENHPHNPSVNATKSSGAPPPAPAPARRRPALLMEGSRCSRVNGRGWRCSQPTLVGYSLCEHHLGKGKLRSMSSVKEEKKKKIGAVKARSLSSLLGVDFAGDMALPPELRRSGEREEY